MSQREPKLSVPPELRRGALKGDEALQVDQGVRLLARVASELGRSSLEGMHVLDVGCGTKLAQAIVDRGVPIGRYVGVDIYGEMIEYLRANVDDPRLAFHSVDFQNAMYNPSGPRMTEQDVLPVGDESFDAIVAFSVFTHLDPEDFRTMLRVLRKHARPGAHLLFTLFIDPNQVEPFRDAVPGKPLLWAYYTERHARELLSGTGWEPLSLHPPTEDTQYYFVCRVV